MMTIVIITANFLCVLVLYLRHRDPENLTILNNNKNLTKTYMFYLEDKYSEYFCKERKQQQQQYKMISTSGKANTFQYIRKQVFKQA